jgi:hypothetical protein
MSADPQPTCLAHDADGAHCQEPATIPDPDRGGLVCWRHAPERWRRFTWTEEDAEGVTWTRPDGTELPMDDEDPEEEAP